MAGRGPAPKPSHLRQRRNVKAGATTLEAQESATVPELPNPDQREWHPLTMAAWRNAWLSPMAGQWLETDFDGLARLAVLWDNFNKTGNLDYAKEIRLQSAAFGLTPLDRSRLQWEFNRADESNQKQQRREQAAVRRGASDPRAALMVVQ